MSTSFAGPLTYSGYPDSNKFNKGIPVDINPDWMVYKKDFFSITEVDETKDFTMTRVDSGGDTADTRTVVAGDANGILKILNNDADNDSTVLQSKTELFKLESGKKIYFECRIKVDNADDCDMMVGLSITDTTPLDSTDRIHFRITEADASIVCKNAKNSTETSTDSGVDAADDTYIKLGFLYNGSNSVDYFVNRNLVATHSTNLPDDENLALTIMYRNGSATAQSCYVDYIFVAQER